LIKIKSVQKSEGHMNETLEKHDAGRKRWELIGIGYVLFILVSAGYVNYTEPYEPKAATAPVIGDILLWTLPYLPLLVFPVFPKWEVRDFGFSINPAVILISLFLTGICTYSTQTVTTTWYGAFSEAFARTGEELFFRGFLYLLLLKIFEKKRRPWVWAILGSALGFTLMHTQTFQTSVIATLGSDPVAFVIGQRLFNIFLTAAAFALLRHWTKSILPGSIIHSLNYGGIKALPFVLIIYAVITYWGYRRKENILFGFEQKPQVTV
jgi:membrane protease YdiL (CAAX protease family)